MDNNTLITLLVIAIALVVIGLTFLIISLIRGKKRRDMLAAKAGGEDQIYLVKGTEYPVVTDSKFAPGTYFVFTDGITSKHVNIRVTGFIKEIKVGKSIDLSNGEKITALSENIILKKKV